MSPNTGVASCKIKVKKFTYRNVTNFSWLRIYARTAFSSQPTVEKWYPRAQTGNAELYGLRYRDINWETGTITIRSARKGGPGVRRIPLHFELAKYLRDWYEADGADEDGYIIHYRRKRIGSLKTAWRRAKERAGISRRLRLYDLRHAAITAMLRSGADLKTVSAIAGHSRVDTTLAIYAHTDIEAARAAIGTIKMPGQHIAKKR